LPLYFSYYCCWLIILPFFAIIIWHEPCTPHTTPCIDDADTFTLLYWYWLLRLMFRHCCHYAAISHCRHILIQRHFITCSIINIIIFITPLIQYYCHNIFRLRPLSYYDLPLRWLSLIRQYCHWYWSLLSFRLLFFIDWATHIDTEYCHYANSQLFATLMIRLAGRHAADSRLLMPSLIRFSPRFLFIDTQIIEYYYHITLSPFIRMILAINSHYVITPLINIFDAFIDYWCRH